MFRQMNNIDRVAQGNQNVFLTAFDNVKQAVISNPAMLTKKYWL